MLGWQIFIHRQVSGQSPDVTNPTNESLLATWMTGIGGTDWLDALVKEGKAVDLGGNRYPCRYTAIAANVLPKISCGPPPHDGPFVIGDDYVLPGGWVGEVRIDHSHKLLNVHLMSNS